MMLTGIALLRHQAVNLYVVHVPGVFLQMALSPATLPPVITWSLRSLQ